MTTRSQRTSARLAAQSQQNYANDGVGGSVHFSRSRDQVTALAPPELKARKWHRVTGKVGHMHIMRWAPVDQEKPTPELQSGSFSSRPRARRERKERVVGQDAPMTRSLRQQLGTVPLESAIEDFSALKKEANERRRNSIVLTGKENEPLSDVGLNDSVDVGSTFESGDGSNLGPERSPQESLKDEEEESVIAGVEGDEEQPRRVGDGNSIINDDVDMVDGDIAIDGALQNEQNDQDLEIKDELMADWPSPVEGDARDGSDKEAEETSAAASRSVGDSSSLQNGSNRAGDLETILEPSMPFSTHRVTVSGPYPQGRVVPSAGPASIEDDGDSLSVEVSDAHPPTESSPQESAVADGQSALSFTEAMLLERAQEEGGKEEIRQEVGEQREQQSRSDNHLHNIGEEEGQEEDIDLPSAVVLDNSEEVSSETVAKPDIDPSSIPVSPNRVPRANSEQGSATKSSVFVASKENGENKTEEADVGNNVDTLASSLDEDGNNENSSDERKEKHTIDAEPDDKEEHAILRDASKDSSFHTTHRESLDREGATGDQVDESEDQRERNVNEEYSTTDRDPKRRRVGSSAEEVMSKAASDMDG